MLPAKKPSEVRNDLEALLKITPQTNISLFNIDIDFFMHYYDLFGPEQETKVISEIRRLLSSLDVLNYHTLFAHHGDEAEARTYKNHFLAASFGKGDPLVTGQEIKRAIDNLAIPLHSTDMKPRERKVDDGRLIVIDPSRITVHMGISRYAGYSPDISELIKQAMDAEEKSKTAESRIVVLP